MGRYQLTVTCAPVAGCSALIAIILVGLYKADGAAKVALFDGVMEHPFAAQVPFFSSEFLLCTAYLAVSSEFSGMPYKVLA